MEQGKSGAFSALFLLSAAMLQFVLLIISMITSFFLPANYGVQPDWSTYLIALVLLGIAAIGLYIQRQGASISQRVGISLGLGLGLVAAIVLFIPGLGIALGWATLGLPWLIVILFQGSDTIVSISPFFVLLSIALYAVFSTIYVISFFQAARRSNSVKQAWWSCILAVLATLLAASLAFSCINLIAQVIFGKSAVVGPSSIPGFSPFVNSIASYQGSVHFMAFWLLTPILVGLVITFLSSFFLRSIIVRQARIQTS